MSIALIIGLALMAAPQSTTDQAAERQIQDAAKVAAYRDAPNQLDDMAAKRQAKPGGKRGKAAKPKALTCAAKPCPPNKP